MRYFDDRDRYADLLNGFVFQGNRVVTADAVIEADSRESGVLEPGDEKTKTMFAQKYRDVVRKVVFGVNCVMIGIENQSNVHYAMPIRVMSEDVKTYEKQLRLIQNEHEKAKDLKSGAEFLGKFSAEDKVPGVISIVVYYGKEPWDGAKDLYDLLELEDVPEMMRPLINHYPIHVLEVRKFLNTEWFQTDLREVFEVIQHAEDKKMLKNFIESAGDRLKNLAEDACEVIAAVTKTPEFAFRNRKYKNEDGGVDMCQGMKDWLAEEKALGHLEGHAEGRAVGCVQGRQEELEKNVAALFEYGMVPEEVAKALKVGLEVVKSWYDDWKFRAVMNAT